MSKQWQIGDVLYEDCTIFEMRKGAHGTVYCVSDPKHNRYAVKIKTTINAEKDLATLRQECAHWLNLAPHINLLSVQNVRFIANNPALITEYVDGHELRYLIESDSLSIGGFIDIMMQACYGLRHLHAQGIQHNDVKPENILVDRHGLIKIADLGHATTKAEPARRGTLPYNLPIGSRSSDYTAIGMILAEAIMGLGILANWLPGVVLSTRSHSEGRPPRF